MSPDRLWGAWNTDPLVLLGLATLGWLYARGTLTVWRLAGHGRGVRPWQAMAFAAGWLALVVALVSPLDALSESLFAAHMIQHLLLMTVAAPLLALGGPVVPLAWAWPRPVRQSLARVHARVHRPMRPLRVLTALPVAFGLHSLALWVRHAPVLYEAALRNSTLHAAEHLVLLGTGILFWSAACWGVTHGGRALGASVLYVFGLGAQCTGLGALIALSSRPWYGFYAQTSGAWGISPTDDQVLAGAIMWVPAGLVYLTLALVLLGSWLRPLPGSAEQYQSR